MYDDIDKPIYTNDWTVQQKQFGSQELFIIWQICFFNMSPNKVVFAPLIAVVPNTCTFLIVEVPDLATQWPDLIDYM